MTMQSVWTSAFVADTPVRKVSFWRRLVISIMEGRQRKADEFMRHYLTKPSMAQRAVPLMNR